MTRLPTTVTHLSPDLAVAIRDLVRAEHNQIFQRPTQQKRRNVTVTALGGVPFRNDSGETVPPYSVMRVTDTVLIDDFPVVTIDKPNSTFARWYLVNGATEVANSKRGTGTWLRDADYVAHETGSPALNEIWGPKPDQWTLAHHYYGFLIEGGATTKGSVNVVRATQHLVTLVKGKTDAAHNKGSTGTVSIYTADGTDTTMNLTDVENDFANVASGKKVHVSWLGEKPGLSAAEC